MTTAYTFDRRFNSARGNSIGIDSQALYGYWERRDGSEGGGLWFERRDGKLALVDYDGTACLGQSIVDALRENGVIADSEFDA
jgi:hypothetical protein